MGGSAPTCGGGNARKCCCAADPDIVARVHGDTVSGLDGVNGQEMPVANRIINKGVPVESPELGTEPSSKELGKPVDNEADLNYFEREKEELALIKVQGVETPFYRFKSGATYDGEWKDGTRHGFGKMVWSDGVTFEGQWQQNVASGKGCFQHIDGDQYVGEWSHNMANGMGVYYHGGIQTYAGQWFDDCQHGVGIESWREGAEYQGEFKRNQKEGVGRYQWEGGSCEYMGCWKNNVIEGHGMCIAGDGRLFFRPLASVCDAWCRQVRVARR